MNIVRSDIWVYLLPHVCLRIIRIDFLSVVSNQIYSSIHTDRARRGQILRDEGWTYADPAICKRKKNHVNTIRWHKPVYPWTADLVGGKILPLRHGLINNDKYLTKHLKGMEEWGKRGTSRPENICITTNTKIWSCMLIYRDNFSEQTIGSNG